MGGQNIKLDLLYIQSILHNSGSNPGLRGLVFFASYFVATQRSLDVVRSIRAAARSIQALLLPLSFILPYLSRQELFRYGFLPSGRCTSNLSFCTVHSSFDSSSFDLSVLTFLPRNCSVMDFFPTAQSCFPTVQTHRCHG